MRLLTRLFLLTGLIILAGCREEEKKQSCGSGEGYAIAFCKQVDNYESLAGKRNQDYIRVDCLVGPEDATVSNAPNGTYYCSGTYKLTSLDNALITMGWGGTSDFSDYEPVQVQKGAGTFSLKMTKTSGGEGNIFLQLGGASITVLVNAGCDEVEAPTDLMAVADKAGKRITLSWSDNSGNETGFEIERSLSETDGFGLIATVPADNNSYIDTSLASDKDYFYRIRALVAGHFSGYSNTVRANIFNETVADFDGNIYSACKIGDQIWMSENLKTTHYSDGIPIRDGTGAGAFDYQDTTSCWFVYDDNPSNKAVYGLLYTCNAMMRGAPVSDASPSGVQGVCPAGWHVPSNAEWDKLVNYLGGPLIAGGKLKEGGSTHWSEENVDATNETGFTALPGGCRYKEGVYVFKGLNALFWTTGALWDVYLEYYSARATRSGASARSAGLSVRCVKN